MGNSSMSPSSQAVCVGFNGSFTTVVAHVISSASVVSPAAADWALTDHAMRRIGIRSVSGTNC